MLMFQPVRTLTTAAVLALAIVSVPAGLAHAAPNDAAKADCERRGLAWDDQKGCADKVCNDDWQAKFHGWAKTVVRNGQAYLLVCNGWTGQLEPGGVSRTQTGTRVDHAVLPGGGTIEPTGTTPRLPGRTSPTLRER